MAWEKRLVGREGYEHKDRYGENWETELKKTVDETLCSIHDIIDQFIIDSTNIFCVTKHANDFSIFHDGLTIWSQWTPKAQSYIHRRKGI